ncbi:uncharacterized protein C8R40DRAFT_1171196 [Lentinula edodes]|uniref:uncharacterized protein n=1 Tax=Lentinula edodes TaxID=5353 RepID=UPI001E8E5AA4|nr:uncharacterized protein C8R40DRAFT_1171196 [Lentinula edodes]KAH7874578.1 hypothetical protein C8R40DRAFT_1171196 [Lentinula edodes]
MRTSQILETDLPNMESEGSDDVYEQNPVIQQYIADGGTITREVESTASTTCPSDSPASTTSITTSGWCGRLARWSPPPPLPAHPTRLPLPPPPPPLDGAADSQGGVHRLHSLPIRLACLYHLHHHLWIVRQTRKVESTASTTFSTSSGSGGGLARWSPPPPLLSYSTRLPLPPPPPPLDHVADSRGGVHYLLICLTRLRIVTMELGESTFLESMDAQLQQRHRDKTKKSVRIASREIILLRTFLESFGNIRSFSDTTLDNKSRVSNSECKTFCVESSIHQHTAPPPPLLHLSPPQLLPAPLLLG